MRLVEDSATAAETARRQQSSEAHSNEIALREQVRNLEQEKHRLHQDAEEADILVSQLQTRLEEKLQQVNFVFTKLLRHCNIVGLNALFDLALY